MRISPTFYGVLFSCALMAPHTAVATSVEQVKDIFPGGTFFANSSNPRHFVVVDGELFFSAKDSDGDTELWKTDGTTAGTVRVKDINPGSTGSAPQSLTNVGGTLFFTAIVSGTGFTGRELWKSDGTTPGTLPVANINPISGSDPFWLTDVNGTVFFRANDGTLGNELYKSDGSGASLVADINTESLAGSDPEELTESGGKLFFRADDGNNGEELWVHDPVTNSTLMLEINPGVGPSIPRSLADIDGTLFFGAANVSFGSELWKSDGTGLGTVLVKDINNGGDSGDPRGITDFNGTAFFTANDGTNGVELWKSDGTEGGTELVADINPGAANAFAQFTDTEMHAVGSTLFFPADDGTNGVELWKTDGTEEGTVMVKDINAGGDSNPGFLTNVNGKLFFVADDGVNGRELWESDGTPGGTVMVANLATGSASAFSAGNEELISFDGSLFFAARDGDGLTGDGIELWRTVDDIVDTDEDGMPDDYEDANGLDKNDPSDAGEDLDMDGVTNLEEYEAGLDPRHPDSDGDGIGDAFDIDPLIYSNLCDEDINGDATFSTNVPENTTLQCAASNSVAVDPGVTIDGTGGRLEVISPSVSLGDGFSVPTGAELSVISADPVPGMAVPLP